MAEVVGSREEEYTVEPRWTRGRFWTLASRASLLMVVIGMGGGRTSW